MIDFELIERLLELLNRSNAGTIEVRKNLWSTTIRVSKDTLPANAGPVTYHVAAGNPSAAAAASPAHAGAAEAAEAAGAAEAHLIDIESPMVGTFYAQPEPGAEPYVRVGSRIGLGQTLCIIEAMKIMNPIDAEASGVITDVLVQDAQPVEFGQVLFRVDPNG